MRQQFFITLWIGVTFFLLGHVGHLLAIPPGVATLIWPASGFALAMLLIFGKKAWLGVFLGAFFVTVEPIVNSDLTSPILSIFSVGVFVAIGCLIQAIAGEWLIQRTLGKNIFKSANTFMLFSLSIPLICLLSSSIGTFTLYFTGFITAQSFTVTWITWWLGDAVGIFLITPFILLVVLKEDSLKINFSLIILYVALVLVTLSSFGFFFNSHFKYHFTFLVWPILLLFALIHERIHTFFAMIIVSVVAVTLTYYEMSPFYEDDLNNSIIVLQTYLIVMAVTSMTISILSTQQRQYKLSLIVLKESLERQVKERTRELQHELSLSKEKDKKLLHQSRLAQVGEMISMIAHQWRQPLASISAIAGTLSIDVIMDNYKKEFFQERLDSITELSQHLSLTIDDFRNFFKVDKSTEDSTLTEIVEGSLHIINPTLKSKMISVELQIEGSPIKIHTYVNEVRQVLLSLLKNAEDVLCEKGDGDLKIWLHGYEDDGNAILSIEDNAGGMPEDIIDKVFDPYFSTKTNKNGTGLGLYMSKIIIEKHCKGKLYVTNSECGAKFTIQLPTRHV